MLTSILRIGLLTACIAFAGCGVSKPYVATNARTILVNSEASLTTLEGLECDDETCTIPARVHRQLTSDQEENVQRAKALCEIADACQEEN